MNNDISDLINYVYVEDWPDDINQIYVPGLGYFGYYHGDFMAFDIDSNGHYDCFVADCDGNGVADHYAFDYDEDGIIDSVYVDYNEDGIFDMQVYC